MANPGEAVALLHAGLMDRHAWQAGLMALADALQAHHLVALVTGTDDARRPDGAIWGARLAEDHLRAFAASDAELRSMTARMGVGRACPSEAVVPDATLYRSRLYHQAVRPAGGHHALAARPTATTLVIACRAQAAGSFSPAEVATLQAALPGLDAALRLKARLRRLEDRSSLLEKALDEVRDLGIILLDHRRVAVHLNRAAEQIVTAADGLHWNGGELTGARHADTARLRRTIGEASGEFCTLSRRSSRKPLVARAVRVDLANSDRPREVASARTLLFVRDPDRSEAGNFDRVAAALGLTRREARLAALLADGRSVAEAAGEIGITIGNARIHLKRIFNKTDTHRQAELVRLLFASKP